MKVIDLQNGTVETADGIKELDLEKEMRNADTSIDKIPDALIYQEADGRLVADFSDHPLGYYMGYNPADR